jgi:hypothetical protein
MSVRVGSGGGGVVVWWWWWWWRLPLMLVVWSSSSKWTVVVGLVRLDDVGVGVLGGEVEAILA